MSLDSALGNLGGLSDSGITVRDRVLEFRNYALPLNVQGETYNPDIMTDITDEVSQSKNDLFSMIPSIPTGYDCKVYKYKTIYDFSAPATSLESPYYLYKYLVVYTTKEQDKSFVCTVLCCEHKDAMEVGNARDWKDSVQDYLKYSYHNGILAKQDLCIHDTTISCYVVYLYGYPYSISLGEDPVFDFNSFVAQQFRKAAMALKINDSIIPRGELSTNSILTENVHLNKVIHICDGQIMQYGIDKYYPNLPIPYFEEYYETVSYNIVQFYKARTVGAGNLISLCSVKLLVNYFANMQDYEQLDAESEEYRNIKFLEGYNWDRVTIELWDSGESKPVEKRPRETGNVPVVEVPKCELDLTTVRMAQQRYKWLHDKE